MLPAKIKAIYDSRFDLAHRSTEFLKYWDAITQSVYTIEHQKKINLRLVLTLLLLVAIAAVFWGQSRYPALDEKAMMSGAIQLEDPMSFEALLTVRPELPIWQKILFTTINWINTNLEGMVFGVLFGAGFLTLLRYVRQRSFQNGFVNSMVGMVMGAPLGVCVNCAAPIARGLYVGGARAETALSAMVSSPTLNIVVLTMMFSLLPFYMAVAKIALSLGIILLAVPVICRFLPVQQLQPANIEQPNCPVPQRAGTRVDEGFIKAVSGVLKDYFTDLWYIVRTTVPLMLLAGLLGSAVATLIPIELLKDTQLGLLSLVAASLIGTFLPVPIAFDVVVSGALLGGGLGVGYVMVLLFTLGIFSVYSFLIVATTISWRAASLLSCVIVVVGVLAGAGADAFHKWQSKRALDLLTGSGFGLISSAQAAEKKPVLRVQDNGHEILVRAQPFRPRSPAADKPFTRMEARHLGIDKPIEFSFKDMWPPFWEGRSITSGDIDNDGDFDLVLASSERGLYTYLNDGTGQFSRHHFPLGRLEKTPIFNAVLVDLNDDGWLDLFLASYANGNFVLWNKNGQFDASNLTPVLNRDDARLVLAVAFGDVDQDGDLDGVFGNWAAGWYRRVPGEEARNRIVLNDNGKLTGESFKELPGMPGETLSVLLSDLDLDGKLDLLVGNDFEQPDIYYFGDGAGGFKRVRRRDGIVPFTATTTMSIKNSDLDNDGQPEIYIAQIAGRSSGVSEKLSMRPIELYCTEIEREEDRRICQKNIDIKNWYKAGNRFDPTFAHKCLEFDGTYRAECKAILVKDLAIQNNDSSICELIPADQKIIAHFCSTHFLPTPKLTAEERLDNIAQIKRRNVLLVKKADGTYEDRSIAKGLDVGGWSWDVKIADFDNDENQDVYIVNGTWVPNEVTPSNLYFSNDGNGTFAEKSAIFGLEDYLITPAATTVDIDNDGDLDMVGVTVNGPVVAFVNNAQSKNSLAFEFRDHAGNRFGIGNRIEIFYGEDGKRKQMRELQTGGGFQSFDAPVAHFGLGQYDQISSLEIHWSNGGTSKLVGPFRAGATYRIERR